MSAKEKARPELTLYVRPRLNYHSLGSDTHKKPLDGEIDQGLFGQRHTCGAEVGVK
ncbi:MAG: hypothetical protein AAF194_04440 [Pseudomonadota bacterium]